MDRKTISMARCIFTDDPAIRFGRTFGTSPDVWRETWRRLRMLDYSNEEAYEYLMFALRRRMRREQFNRWLARTEVYNLAQVALRKGAREVHPYYFGRHTDFVLRELAKNSKKHG